MVITISVKPMHYYFVGVRRFLARCLYLRMVARRNKAAVTIQAGNGHNNKNCIIYVLVEPLYKGKDDLGRQFGTG